MKIEVETSTIKLIPESNEDWFEAGRITKNLGVEINKTHERLSAAISNIEIPLKVALNMLSEGKITEKEKWEE